MEVAMKLWHIHEAEVARLKMSEAPRHGSVADYSVQWHAPFSPHAQLGGFQTNWHHLFVEVHQLPDVFDANILAAQTSTSAALVRGRLQHGAQAVQATTTQ